MGEISLKLSNCIISIIYIILNNIMYSLELSVFLFNCTSFSLQNTLSEGSPGSWHQQNKDAKTQGEREPGQSQQTGRYQYNLCSTPPAMGP